MKPRPDEKNAMLTAEGNRDIYTLGTSNRSADEFMELLKGHAVEVVVDVRKFPTSRFEHFRRERLAKLLAEAGIDYIYMGQELGGYRPEGYQAFMATPESRSGIERLEELARMRRAAIVCAERFPWRCHRRFIGFEMERRGWQVTHIIDQERDWTKKKPQVADGR